MAESPRAVAIEANLCGNDGKSVRLTFRASHNAPQESMYPVTAREYKECVEKLNVSLM
jgi:hypothetical protein